MLRLKLKTISSDNIRSSRFSNTRTHIVIRSVSFGRNKIVRAEFLCWIVELYLQHLHSSVFIYILKQIKWFDCFKIARYLFCRPLDFGRDDCLWINVLVALAFHFLHQISKCIFFFQNLFTLRFAYTTEPHSFNELQEKNTEFVLLLLVSENVEIYWGVYCVAGKMLYCCTKTSLCSLLSLLDFEWSD